MLDENAVVKGLNIPDAMKRLMNNAKLYTRLMQKFLEGEELNVLKRALESRNVQASVTAAHTVKGTAANLSAETIHLLAMKLEMSLKSAEVVDVQHLELLTDIESEYVALKGACAGYLEG